MKKELSQKIEIPNDVEIEVIDGSIKVKGKEGENLRKFNLGKVNLEKKDNYIILSNKNATKKEKKIINTTISHIKNMIKGAQEKFVYHLKICSSHFPMTVKIEGNKAIIKNFLGEKANREIIIPQGAEVKVEKDLITIKSIDKEIAGQAAANFETGTIIKNRDRKIFQDGIYITNKAGEEI